MNISEFIKNLRKQKGLTQKQLGELCNPRIGESTIRKYELGILNPKKETLQKIGKALAVYYNDMELFESLSQYAEDDESIKILLNSIFNEIIKNNPDFKAALRDTKHTVYESIIENHKILIKKYDSLNETGQKKALDPIEMLAKIPEYRKEKFNSLKSSDAD